MQYLKNGKRMFGVFSGMAAVGGVCVFTLSKTIGLDRWKSMTHLYTSGYPQPVSDSLCKLTEEVMDDMKLSDELRNNITPYMSIRIDLFSDGMSKLPSGGLIAFPRTYPCFTDFDIITLGGEFDVGTKFSWLSSEGDELANSMLLSEQAKKFGVAREIYSLNTLQPITKTLYIGITSGLTYIFSTLLYNKLNIDLLPLMYCYPFYTITYIFMCTFFYINYRLLCNLYKKKIDRSAGDINLDYSKGGVEFYEKMIERNLLMRRLLGKNGEKNLDELGNNTSFLSLDHGNTHRRDVLKKIVENK